MYLKKLVEKVSNFEIKEIQDYKGSPSDPRGTLALLSNRRTLAILLPRSTNQSSASTNEYQPNEHPHSSSMNRTKNINGQT